MPPPARVLPPSCSKDLFHFLDWTPAIKPVYANSLNSEECGGQAAFSPVTYRTWLPPHSRSIYIVKLPASLSR